MSDNTLSLRARLFHALPDAALDKIHVEAETAASDAYAIEFDRAERDSARMTAWRQFLIKLLLPVVDQEIQQAREKMIEAMAQQADKFQAQLRQAESALADANKRARMSQAQADTTTAEAGKFAQQSAEKDAQIAALQAELDGLVDAGLVVLRETPAPPEPQAR